MESRLSLLMVHCKHPLYRKKEKGCTIKEPETERQTRKGRSELVMDFGCYEAVYEQAWKSFTLFRTPLSTLHKVLVYGGYINILIILSLTLINKYKLRVMGECIFIFCSGE